MLMRSLFRFQSKFVHTDTLARLLYDLFSQASETNIPGLWMSMQLCRLASPQKFVGSWVPSVKASSSTVVPRPRLMKTACDCMARIASALMNLAVAGVPGNAATMKSLSAISSLSCSGEKICKAESIHTVQMKKCCHLMYLRTDLKISRNLQASASSICHMSFEGIVLQ